MEVDMRFFIGAFFIVGAIIGVIFVLVGALLLYSC